MCIAFYKYFKGKSGIKLILGFNRDELYDRSWEKPDFHWGNNLFGCKDTQSSGSWIVSNSSGLTACILNTGIIDLKKKQSRGLLPLIIDNCHSAKEAIEKIVCMTHPDNYQGFLLYLFDKEKIMQISNTCGGLIQKKLTIRDIEAQSGVISKFGVNSGKTIRGRTVYNNLKNITSLNDTSLIFFKEKMISEDNKMVLKDKLWGTTSSTLVSLTHDGKVFWDYSNNQSHFKRVQINNHG